MTLARRFWASTFAALLVSGCGADSPGAASCDGKAPTGDFTAIRQGDDDPVVTMAIATAAETMRSSSQRFLGEYDGYEGRKRGDGARCFQFSRKSCAVGGSVSLCVSPSLKVQDVLAAE